MKRAVIVCGADINNYEYVKSHFCDDDYYIYCDSGLKHEEMFKPANLIVGDFDSHERPENRDDAEVIVLPREKDDTDSVYAVKEAVKRGFEDVLIVGAIGNRLDHGLVNVYTLIYLYELGINAVIIDDYSEMLLVGKNKPESVDIKYEYFSLVAISGEAREVNITSAKYTLDGADITPSYQYATSNEPLKESGKPAEISLREGYLLLIKITGSE